MNHNMLGGMRTAVIQSAISLAAVLLEKSRTIVSSTKRPKLQGRTLGWNLTTDTQSSQSCLNSSKHSYTCSIPFLGRSGMSLHDGSELLSPCRGDHGDGLGQHVEDEGGHEQGPHARGRQPHGQIVCCARRGRRQKRGRRALADLLRPCLAQEPTGQGQDSLPFLAAVPMQQALQEQSQNAPVRGVCSR